MWVYLWSTDIVGGWGWWGGMSLWERLNMAKTCWSLHKTRFSYSTNCWTMECPIIVCWYWYIHWNIAWYGTNCYGWLKVNWVQIMDCITTTDWCDYWFPVAPWDCIQWTRYWFSNYTHNVWELYEYY